MAPHWLKRIVRGPRLDADMKNEENPVDKQYHKREQEYRKQRRKELQDPNKPPYLATTRLRTLEYAVGNHSVHDPVGQKTFGQEQSALMQLPAELRISIFEAFCGNQIIHLWFGFWPGNWRGGRVSSDNSDFLWSLPGQKRTSKDFPNQWNFFHSICPYDASYSPAISHWHCRYFVRTERDTHRLCAYVNGAKSFEPYDARTIGVLPILLTCRKAFVNSKIKIYDDH
jgi:hypothetical protein